MLPKPPKNYFHNFLQRYVNKRVIDLFADPDAIYAMSVYGASGGTLKQQLLVDAPTITFDYSQGAFGVLNSIGANRQIVFTNLNTPSVVMMEVVHTTQNTSISLPGKLATGFAWSTNLNGITMVNGIYDGTTWFWSSNTF